MSIRSNEENKGGEEVFPELTVCFQDNHVLNISVDYAWYISLFLSMKVITGSNK